MPVRSSDVFDIFALGFMTPYLSLFITQEFGVDLAQATYFTGLATTFRYLCYAASSPIWGWLSDKLGSKAMLLRVMAGHSIAFFLLFLSRNVYEFTAFLCLDALLGSMTTPVYIALSDATEPKELTRVLSFQQAIQTIGSVMGPGVRSILAYYLGYRLTFLVASLNFAFLIPLTLLFRFEKPKRDAEEAQAVDVRRRIIGNLHFLGFEFVSLILSYAAINFIAPITPLCLQTLGVPMNQLLYYSSLIATFSTLCYAVAIPIGTRYIKRRFLPALAVAATAMALIQSYLFIDVRLFMILQIGMRTVQAPIQCYMIGGTGLRRRGVQMGLLNSGIYVGNALGPFIASTAPVFGLAAAFKYIASTQFGASLLLFLQNRQINGAKNKSY